MNKYFNIAGPCHPDKHYMLSAQERCHSVLDLIIQEQYFVIYAARQSGKTTLLLELARQLNANSEYHALYCTLESVQRIEAMEQGIPAILRELTARIEVHATLQRYAFADRVNPADFNTALRMALTHLCQQLDKPLVILFDEVDCLSNGTLIAFLRQLRAGYVTRYETPFPHSVGLIGMRNIRDYKARVRDDRETLGSASPFNIATEALTLRNFTQKEIARLYAQHTEQTGQVFPLDVVHAVFEATQGQPWLVNAIARDIIVKQLQNDVTRPILLEYVYQAVETLVRQRSTHLDSLMERLKETRVQRIVEPVILGEPTPVGSLDDDYQYVLDLGLLREVEHRLEPANPIYAEVMIRTLSNPVQVALAQQPLPAESAYVKERGLDMRHLLEDFQTFWRQNSEPWDTKIFWETCTVEEKTIHVMGC